MAASYTVEFSQDPDGPTLRVRVVSYTSPAASTSILRADRGVYLGVCDTTDLATLEIAAATVTGEHRTDDVTIPVDDPLNLTDAQANVTAQIEILRAAVDAKAAGLMTQTVLIG